MVSKVRLITDMVAETGSNIKGSWLETYPCEWQPPADVRDSSIPISLTSSWIFTLSSLFGTSVVVSSDPVQPPRESGLLFSSNNIYFEVVNTSTSLPATQSLYISSLASGWQVVDNSGGIWGEVLNSGENVYISGSGGSPLFSSVLYTEWDESGFASR